MMINMISNYDWGKQCREAEGELIELLSKAYVGDNPVVEWQEVYWSDHVKPKYSEFRFLRHFLESDRYLGAGNDCKDLPCNADGLFEFFYLGTGFGDGKKPFIRGVNGATYVINRIQKMDDFLEKEEILILLKKLRKLLHGRYGESREGNILKCRDKWGEVLECVDCEFRNLKKSKFT